MARIGADVDQLDQLARTFRSSASTLSSVASGIDGAIRATWWAGVHADDFRTGWTARDRARVQQVASVLEQLAGRIDEQAVEQRQASDQLSAGGGGGGSWLGNMLGDARDRMQDAVVAAARQAEVLTTLEDLPPGNRADYWNRLDPEMQAALLASSPGVLMLMSGIPLDVRRQAERAVAERVADDVAYDTTQAFLDAEVDILGWEAEGRAAATYAVFGDGHVEMELRLEAGLGREVEVGGVEVEGSAGGTTNLKLRFDSAEEARAFLDGLDDAAFDLHWTEYGSAPAHVASNVAEYVMAQDIRDARVGVYGQVQVEMERAAVDFEATGRVEGYYDVADGERGLIVSGEAELSFGGQEDARSYAARTDVRAELMMDADNAFQELKIEASFGGTATLEALGYDVPGANAGTTTHATFIVADDNPARAEIVTALAEGDVSEATRLAAANAEVRLQQQAVVSASSSEHDISIAGQGVEVEYGLSHHTAATTWIRPAGGQDFHAIDRDVER